PAVPAAHRGGGRRGHHRGRGEPGHAALPPPRLRGTRPAAAGEVPRRGHVLPGGDPEHRPRRLARRRRAVPGGAGDAAVRRHDRRVGGAVAGTAGGGLRDGVAARPGRGGPVRLDVDRGAGRGDGGDGGARHRRPDARVPRPDRLAAPVAAQRALARLRRPAAQPGALGLLRRQRPAPARVRRRLRGPRLRPLHHQGRPLLTSPADSPLPTHSPLPTESSVPTDSSLPTESPLPDDVRVTSSRRPGSGRSLASEDVVRVHAAARLHHPAHPPGHLRDGRLDALDRHRDGAVGARARRERLRRRRRRGVRAPRRRAAPQRPRWGHAGDLHHGAGSGAPGGPHGPGAGAGREYYRSLRLELVPGAGALAATVPGAVDAWLLLLRDHGTWELADVLAPAIGYARDGHPVLAATCRTIAQVERLFTEHWPTSAALWLPDGRVPRPGELVRNPAYARTLERLVEAGSGAGDRVARVEAARHVWREGFVAEAVAASASRPHRHSDGGDHAGVIT